MFYDSTNKRQPKISSQTPKLTYEKMMGEKTKLLWQNPEYRKYMSEVHKGKIFSKEIREKMSKSHKGRKPYLMTEKIKSNISKGIELFFQEHPEAREKISKAHIGKKHPMSEETKLKIGKANKGKYFSEEAKIRSSAVRQGISVSEWQNFITPINERERRKIEAKLWQKDCLQRDNFTCQKCKQRGLKLVVHHINNFADFPEIRTVLSNGIVLCKKCHLDFHKKYGKRNNTKEQLEEFLKDN